MLRIIAAVALLIPAAAAAQDNFNQRFLPVTPGAQGGFTVGRRIGTGGSDYFCRAGEWARRQGASYSDRVEVVRSGSGGVNFRIASGGRSSGGIILGARAGESRTVGHALALCDRGR